MINNHMIKGTYDLESSSTSSSATTLPSVYMSCESEDIVFLIRQVTSSDNLIKCHISVGGNPLR